LNEIRTAGACDVHRAVRAKGLDAKPVGRFPIFDERMRRLCRFTLAVTLLQGVLNCAPSKPPGVAANAGGGPIRFAVSPHGPRGTDTMTLRLSLYNASDRELYVSYRPRFDWIGAYAVGRHNPNELVGWTAASARASLLSLDGPICAEPSATFVLRKGETLARIVKLEIPDEHRPFPKLDVLVNLDVPVFDATLSCRENPWVSGAAATVVE
jgi:hypothetical protein